MFRPAGFTPEAGAACSRRIAAMPDRGRLADGKSRDEPRPARLRFQWRPLPTAQKKLRTGKTGPELQLRTYGRGLHARKFTLPCFSFSGIFCRPPPRRICRRAAGSPCGRFPCIALPAANRRGIRRHGAGEGIPTDGRHQSAGRFPLRSAAGTPGRAPCLPSSARRSPSSTSRGGFSRGRWPSAWCRFCSDKYCVSSW